MPSTLPSRRGLLAGAAGIAGAALLSGCSDDRPPAAAPEVPLERRMRETAVRDSERLLERYDATTAAHPALAQRLAPLRASVAAHTAALADEGSSAASSSSASPSRPAAPASASSSASPSPSASPRPSRPEPRPPPRPLPGPYRCPRARRRADRPRGRRAEPGRGPDDRPGRRPRGAGADAGLGGGVRPRARVPADLEPGSLLVTPAPVPSPPAGSWRPRRRRWPPSTRPRTATA